MTPIDIIAHEIVADGHTAERMAATLIARTATAALTDPAIVDNAVQALLADGWLGMEVRRDNLPDIARTVLRSVGGA